MTTQLSDNHEKEKVVLFDVDYTLYNTDTFKESGLQTHQLYDEVVEVLETLSSVATLGIFSEGDTALQQSKLVGGKVEQYFPVDHVHIVLNKEEAIQHVFDRYKEKDVYIVDDKLPILRLLKQYMPALQTVWVKRGKYAEKQEAMSDFTPDYTMTTLTDLPSIIQGGKA